MSPVEMLFYGALPALVAAFCYPNGNQLVWQVSYNSKKIHAKKINAEKRDATEQEAP